MANCELKPARVFEQFAKINAIPRPSKKEEKMIEYLKSLARAVVLTLMLMKPVTSSSVNQQPQATKTNPSSFCKVTWIWFANIFLKLR